MNKKETKKNKTKPLIKTNVSKVSNKTIENNNSLNNNSAMKKLTERKKIKSGMPKLNMGNKITRIKTEPNLNYAQNITNLENKIKELNKIIEEKDKEIKELNESNDKNIITKQKEIMEKEIKN